MMIAWSLLLFILGASIGSFLNVLVSRTVEGIDWVKGRSRCDYCKKTLQWFDMVPLLSFLVYGGKSRCCDKPISWQHPLVEFMTGSLFVWWYVMGNGFFALVTEPMRSLQAGYWLLIGVVLLIVFVADFVYGVVPTIPVYLMIGVSLVYRLLLYIVGPLTFVDLGLYLLCAVFAWGFFYLLYIVTKKRGMGMGDVILAPLLGLVLGYPRTIVGVVFAFWIGAICGICLILLGKKRFGQTLPFAPFMVIGAGIALLFGTRLWELLF